MSQYQFRLIFNKAKSDNTVVQWGYNKAYEGIVNYAFELFGIDSSGLDSKRWDDPEGQCVTWTGTYEECVANQQKLKNLRPRVLHDFRIKAQGWLNSWWFPLRKQRAAINAKLEHFEKAEDTEGGVWKALQSSLMLFGVIMTDDIVEVKANEQSSTDVKTLPDSSANPIVNDNKRTE